jgi:AAA family ATP:ADP antiporter
MRSQRLTHDASGPWPESLVAAAILLIGAAFVLAKTARDTLFIQDRGLLDLPLAYIGIAMLAGPLAAVVLSLFRALGVRVVRIVLPATTAVLLVGFSIVARPGGGALMIALFVFVPLVWGVIYSTTWLLAAELLAGAPPERAARAFGTIGAAALAGGLLAGVTARMLVPVTEPRVFFWLAAAGLLATSLVLARVQRLYCAAPRIPLHTARVLPALRIRGLLRRPYVRTLLAVGMAMGAVGVMVEFRFYLAVAVSGGSVRDKAAFFADFYAMLNLAGLVVQVGILPALLRRFGTGAVLSALPASLVGAGAGLLVSGSLPFVVATKMTESSLKASLHRASWEHAYLALDRSEQALSKLVVDGLGTRIAEGLTAMAILAWLRLVVVDGDLGSADGRWPTLVLLAGALFWLAATRKLAGQLLRRSGEPPPMMPPSAPLPGG